jgi:hypothetical protein
MNIGAVTAQSSTTTTGGELQSLVESRAGGRLAGARSADAVSAAATDVPDLRHVILAAVTVAQVQS